MTDYYDIRDIAKKLGIEEKELIPFGYDKAKIDFSLFQNKERKGKLVLCTAITPTKAGEGKTTTAIGLADGLALIGVNSMLCLREPSLGPVFGVKGGGAGGGEEILEPLDEINLHFTGDMHAITSVNNLLVAMIDNELYQNSELHVDPERIVFPRAMDMNDRSLRDINVNQNDKKVSPHHSSFVITAASEIMAVFCLSKDEEDFLNRVEDITLAFDTDGNPITAKKLDCHKAIEYLIHTALYPNLVKTKYNTPAFVHGGPFANIAHGTNTLIATDLALKLSDVVVTEAGFGSDLGMEKYLDIVAPKLNTSPSLIVMVVTIRALKLHGGVSFESLTEENVEAMEQGIENLQKHLDNVSLYHLPYLVSINRFKDDKDSEIAALEEYLNKKNIPYALNTSYVDGPEGAKELAIKAKEILDSTDNSKFEPLIKKTMTLEEKIETIAKNIYGAKEVVYSDYALDQLKQFKEMGYSDFDICISKTPNSLSDDPHLINTPKDHTLHVREFRLFTGARFIVPLTGAVFTMPGLPKVPAAKNMKGTQK